MIDGLVEPGFGSVRAAFEECFTEHGEIGASVAVHVDGRPVVDLWGGIADPSTGARYRADTVQTVFSVSKGAIATCASLLLQRGQLELDAPVSRYWPEFAEHGKESITVRAVLCHQAGLPVIDRPLHLEDVLAWDPVADALAAQRPAWTDPGVHGYHALTFGWLVGELVRRTDGRSIGRFFAEEVAAPLGLDFWIGLPPELDGRLARVVAGPPPEGKERRRLVQHFGPGTVRGRSLSLNGLLTLPVYEQAEVRRAEIPSANGVANARALARLYAALGAAVNGDPGPAMLDRSHLDRARSLQTHGDDVMLSTPDQPVASTFGLGFMVASSGFAPWAGAGAFGHAGVGGSLGFADPASGLAFGYTPNLVGTPRFGSATDPRAARLVGTVYRSLGIDLQPPQPVTT